MSLKIVHVSNSSNKKLKDINIGELVMTANGATQNIAMRIGLPAHSGVSLADGELPFIDLTSGVLIKLNESTILQKVEAELHVKL